MSSFLTDQVLVISYYTLNTPYEKEVENLRTSCKKFGIDAYLEGVNCRGSWERNCAIKPLFILNKWNQFRRPLFFVDADAIFRQRPDFEFLFSYDFSVLQAKTEDSRFKVRAASLFINATSGGKRILEDWCKETIRRIEEEQEALPFLDQSTLSAVIERNKEVSICPLPLSYCKVFDFDSSEIAQEEVVIEQYQASRRFKYYSQQTAG